MLMSNQFKPSSCFNRMIHRLLCIDPVILPVVATAMCCFLIGSASIMTTFILDKLLSNGLHPTVNNSFEVLTDVTYAASALCWAGSAFRALRQVRPCEAKQKADRPALQRV